MHDELIRRRIHHAVDTHSASLSSDPFLAARIIAQTQRKETPRMKKRSTGIIIAVILMLLSVTAVAVGLGIEEIWQQSFSKMGTRGEIWNLGQPTEDDLSMEEAAALARKAIQQKFGTPDEELDAMGFYPTYIPVEESYGETYPSQWRFLWSSRTNVDLDYDYTDYGPTGEYRVYLYAVTGEIDICNFYTNHFWDYAQRVWDCGSYDEVYWHYNKTDFYCQPADRQAYWTQLLADKGYDVRTRDEELSHALLSAELDLQFCELSRIADNDLPLVAAAWAAVEEYTGLTADMLQKYCYVATIPDWHTGYDDVCIHFSYELEWAKMNTGHLDTYSDWLHNYARNLGMYMVSFEKGTANTAAVTHVPRSEYTLKQHVVTQGPLLLRTDWTAADFTVFDAEYDIFDRAVKRMRAAGLADADIQVIVRDYFRRMGIQSESYPAAPEELDALQWFAEENQWDAAIIEPALTYTEFVEKYSADRRFWPQELLIALEPGSHRMPKDGETTFDEARRRALAQLELEQGVSDLTGWTINVQRISLTADPDQVDCRWQVFITEDPHHPTRGWKITFGEWAEHIDVPYIQDITDPGNG